MNNNECNYLFLAPGFEEIEALATVDILRRAGMPLQTVAVNDGLLVTGAHGVSVEADYHIDDIDCNDADWLILPGGMPGASNLADCKQLVKMLMNHDAAGKHIAAICASPAIVLAPLGLLENRRATCYPGMAVEGHGVQWIDDMVAVDGTIVTGRGPAAACDMALCIVAMTKGEDIARQVAQGMLL